MGHAQAYKPIGLQPAFDFDGEEVFGHGGCAAEAVKVGAVGIVCTLTIELVSEVPALPVLEIL